jgi:hypothetical protein
MSCNKSTLQKHSAKVHEKDRKPEAIAPLTPNEEIEEWVCLMTLDCILCIYFCGEYQLDVLCECAYFCI